MISCLICLSSLEGLHSAVCLNSCGHVFHGCCIVRWCETHPTRTCPKCRCFIPHLNGLTKVYFEQGGDRNINDSIQDLFNENQICRRKIDLLMKEVNQHVSSQITLSPNHTDYCCVFQLITIDNNTKEISVMYQQQAASLEKQIASPGAENQPIALKSVAVLLSRSEEDKRIQDYFDKYGSN